MISLGDGWVWPVPLWEGRTPVITQEWKPGHDPAPGESSDEHANHLGVDIMFDKLPFDPPGNIVHLAESRFIAPEGTPIIAAGDGKIWEIGESCYGKFVRLDHPGQGVNTFYQHLASWERPWKKGDDVRAGEILGRMGYSSCAGPDGVRHLHFEIWSFEGGGTNRGDPAPIMAGWPKIEISTMIASTSRFTYSLGALAGVPILPAIVGFLLGAWWFGRRRK